MALSNSVFGNRCVSFFYVVVSLLTALPVVAQNAASLVDRGLAAERSGLVERAEAYYREAIEQDSAEEAYLRLGIMMQHAERYAEAADLLCHSASGLGLSHLSICLAERKQWDEARSVAERAIELGETTAPMTTLALCESAQGRHINAQTWAAKALKANPNDARANNVMGVICFRKGADNDALRYFRKAVSLDSNDVDAYYNLGTMYCLRNNSETAVIHIKKGLKLHPKSAKLYSCLGRAYAMRGDSQRAVACYERILQIDSTNLNALIRIGNIYCDEGHYDQAQAYFKRATLVDPSSPEGHKGQGRTYTASGDYRKAVQAYIRATQLDNTDHETYLMMADLYNKQNNAQREKNCYKKSAKLGNKTAQQWCVKHGLAW